MIVETIMSELGFELQLVNVNAIFLPPLLSFLVHHFAWSRVGHIQHWLMLWVIYMRYE